MNVKTNFVFSPKQVSKEVFPEVLSGGSKVLENSRKLKKYNSSIREIFGLCILTFFRGFLEPEKHWFFLTETQLADDGAIASFDNHKITYYECIEQVYLPGKFLKRKHDQSVNDFILDHISRTKGKGPGYRKNKTLFILSDINSINLNDYFEWQDFASKFFNGRTFLHLYFLS